MTLIDILICCLPVGLIFLAILTIASSAASAYRSGKRLYNEINPYMDNLKNDFNRVQDRTSSISKRSQDMATTFEEIQGRVNFIVEYIYQLRKSLVFRLFKYADNFTEKHAS